MPQNVSKSRFKAKALQYFRQVKETRKEIIVTDRGRPVVRSIRTPKPSGEKSKIETQRTERAPRRPLSTMSRKAQRKEKACRRLRGIREIRVKTPS